MHRAPGRAWPTRCLAPLAWLALTGCTGDPDVVARDGAAGQPSRQPASPPAMLALNGDLDVHDPSVVASASGFVLFHTGPGLSVKRSADLLTWRAAGSVFAENPRWIADEVPGVTHLWSPDVARFGDTHHLYYAASTFGSSRSCIGHATKPDLDSDEPWSDLGPLVCSNTGDLADDWNAIDPGVVIDADGAAWLVFGSFGSGLKLVPLDASGARAGDRMHALAMRPDDGGAIQAATLVRHAELYYLFASFDYCCRGVASTHRIMVGRSSDVIGPYVDRAGRPMLEGGGTLLVEGDDHFRGPGSNSVLALDGASYDVYHAYDVNDGGRATLRIGDLAWDAEGWPISAGP